MLRVAYLYFGHKDTPANDIVLPQKIRSSYHKLLVLLKSLFGVMGCMRTKTRSVK